MPDAPLAPGLGSLTSWANVDKPAGTVLKTMRTFGAYAAVLVHEGSGVYRDDHGEREIAAGDLILVFPEVPHRYGPRRNEAWREFYIVFDGPVFDTWRAAGLLNPAQPIWRLPDPKAWLQRLQDVVAPSQSPDDDTELARVCRLQSFLASAAAASDAMGGRHKQLNWAERACSLLEQDLEQPADLHGIAARLSMSYENFRKKFTQATGRPPARYRSERTIARAQTLMQTSGMNDQQIAHALGFSDGFYFSRRFKQIAGMTPSAYRKQIHAGE